MIRWRLMLTPWAVRRIKRQLTESTYIGFNSYYLFGFRVAQIQGTKPWETIA